MLASWKSQEGLCWYAQLGMLRCRAGSLNAAKCEELGVHGRYRTLLKEGETITTRSGITVRPEEVRAILCMSVL